MWMSLLKIELKCFFLRKDQVWTFSNSNWIFAREEAFQLDLQQWHSLIQLQQWHSAKCLIFFVFYTWLSICCCVKRQRMPKNCTLFCLVHIQKCSFLTFCGFWFVFLNASSHLHFWLFRLRHRRLRRVRFACCSRRWFCTVASLSFAVTSDCEDSTMIYPSSYSSLWNTFLFAKASAVATFYLTHGKEGKTNCMLAHM